MIRPDFCKHCDRIVTSDHWYHNVSCDSYTCKLRRKVLNQARLDRMRRDPVLWKQHVAKERLRNQDLKRKTKAQHRALIAKDRKLDRVYDELGNPCTLLTFEKYWTLCQSSCIWCNQRPSLGADRMYNDIGHISTNCFPCCESCNIILGTLPWEVKCELKQSLCSAYRKGMLNKWKPPYKSCN